MIDDSPIVAIPPEEADAVDLFIYSASADVDVVIF